jgi:hypothetical protein
MEIESGLSWSEHTRLEQILMGFYFLYVCIVEIIALPELLDEVKEERGHWTLVNVLMDINTLLMICVAGPAILMILNFRVST